MLSSIQGKFWLGRLRNSLVVTGSKRYLSIMPLVAEILESELEESEYRFYFQNCETTPVFDSTSVSYSESLVLFSVVNATLPQYSPPDAWGRVLGVYNGSGTPLTESTIGNRILWQGREYSWKTGLYYFRTRFYEPVIGRWLSNDSIGIAGGLNLYEFCGSDPVNTVDPFGTWNYWMPWTWGVGNAVGYNWWDSFNPLHESAGWSWTLAWEESKIAAATLDGIIPFWDPFETAYTSECGVRDWEYDFSRTMGAFSRNAYLAVVALRTAGYRGEVNAWRSKETGKMLDPEYHFHLGRGSGLDKHHLPSEAGRWFKNLWGIIKRQF